MMGLVFLFVPLAVLLAVSLTKRRVADNTALRECISMLTAALGGRQVGLGLSGDLRGRPFSVGVSESAKNTPSTISIELTSTDEREAPAADAGYRRDGRPHLAERPWVVLRREGIVDRIGKLLGINREVTIGDEAFDRAVYIEADAPDADVAKVLAEPRLRAAVLRVLELGFDRVVLHDGADTIRAKRLSPTEDQISIGAVREVLEQLDVIAVSLPTFEGDELSSAPQPYDQRLAVTLPAIFVPVFAVMFGAMSGQMAHLAGSHGIWVSIGVGLVVWAPIAVALARWMRGRADSFRRFLWAAIPIAITLAAAAGGGLPLLNRTWDEAPSTVHELRVSRRYITTSKRNVTHHVHVRGPDGLGDIELPNASFFDTVQIGQVLSVEIHPGALGWPWIGEVRRPRR